VIRGHAGSPRASTHGASLLHFIGPLLVLLLAAAGPGHAAPTQEDDVEARPPNILLLFADDQRTDTIGAWGNDRIRTPHLDRLAADGFSFRRAYCMGSPHGAVCVPSRAMLHTGQPYFRVDLRDFEGRRTLGELLRERGYRTFATGKWHNGRGAFRRSFESARGVYFGGMSDHNAYPQVDLEEGVLSEPRMGDGHSSELIADAAVDFLGTADGDAPFFCYVAFTAPHDPRDPPPAYREPYYERRPELPPNFLPQHPFDNGFLVLRDENLGPWPRTEALVSDQLAEYYGLITHLDEQVGRILAALAESGRADDTLVVYAADHGLALGSHGLLGKQSVYEHSVGAPLIVRGPGIPAGGTSEALVYLLDLFPTLLRRAGVTPPADTLGADLAPLWTGAAPRVRDTLFMSMGTTQRAVRDGRWKLIRYPAVDHLQLFDLAKDPHELTNLAREPEHAERITTLGAELRAWQRRVGDDAPWTAKETVPLRVDLTGKARKPDRWQPAWIRDKYFDE
jgi:arylsulfatase A-like enzyme